MIPKPPQICPICGESGDGKQWCAMCRDDIEVLLTGYGKTPTPAPDVIEWAAKRGRNFERLRNRKKRRA